MSKKKEQQLGINHSTASARLIKDILFSFVKEVPCYRCGLPLSREDFSIDHKEPWLNTEDPVKLYFDIDNVSYSHIKCNTEAARKYRKYATPEERREARNKRESEAWRQKTPEERKADRRARYLKYKK